MRDPVTSFSEISGEAMLLHQQIPDAAIYNPNIKELYKGCQLFFSPLIEKPEYLLIGFNPGGGYQKCLGKLFNSLSLCLH